MAKLIASFALSPWTHTALDTVLLRWGPEGGLPQLAAAFHALIMGKREKLGHAPGKREKPCKD